MRRCLLVPLLLATLPAVALAAADWQPLGEDAGGNRVVLDAASVRTVGAITAVTFRTELKLPLETAGGAITSLRSHMRVNCKEQTAAGVEVVLFEDEAANRAFARNKAAKIVYAKEPAGSSADLVVRRVCRR